METIGRWRLLAEVGRGGMGVVWRAVDPAGREAALKLLLAGRAATAQQRKRFAREVEALGRVRHEHVVGLLEAGEVPGAGSGPGTPWLALQWIEGETLARRLERQGRLSAGEALELLLPLAEALDACHRVGVLHRDLKPENVLLRDRDGAPLLTDFGIARELTPDDQRSALTRSGQWLGTPGWSPPEVMRGDLAGTGPPSDVYGLGALLFACLTGEPPQAGDGLLELIAAAHQPPRSPRALVPGVPRGLDELCLRCLDPEPGRRPGSAAEVAAALRRARAELIGLPGTARRRQRALAAGALLGCALAAGAVIVLGLSAGSAAPAPATAEEHFLRAVARTGQGDLPGALREYEQALSLDPGHARALVNRGLLLARSGEPARGLLDLDRALELLPGEAHAWFCRGNVRHEAGDAAGARADYDQALRLDPEHVEARVARGLLRRATGDAEGAREDYDLVLRLEPRKVAALVNRAVVRRELGDLEGALTDLDQALMVDPDHTVARVNRGSLLRRRGDLAGARADYDRALRVDPTYASAWVNRGTVKREEGDLPGARADYDRAVELAPGDPTTWYNRAVLRAAQDDLPGALADYERTMALAPELTPALLGRADARERTGDRVGAEQDLERALRLLPPDAPEAVQARDWLARLRR